MSDGEDTNRDIPAAQVSRRQGISMVWVIPLVAALIGAWVAYKALSEKGPTITIMFDSAEGLVAGKTSIRYKDVEVGKVGSIDLSEDIKHVIVTAEMSKDARKYLTVNTRFWVVRASISAGNVTGLSTLLGGAYIGIDPVADGEHTRKFKGLETAPVVTTDQPGQHFRLRAKKLGSLDIGSPVYLHQIKVGEVVSYELSEDGEGVDFKIFVNDPHHNAVRDNTRFWNASGLNVSLSAKGIKVDTASMVSLMIGGISFEIPETEVPGGRAPDDNVFRLYENRDEAMERTLNIKRKYLLYFDGSVRGLAKDAPVEFRGIQIGKVLDINAEFDPESGVFKIPVLVETEPERLAPTTEIVSAEESVSQLERLVEMGLRARLKTGNMLTGQLYVDLDFYPDATAAQVDTSGDYPVVPTIPTSIEEITRSVTAVLKKLEEFPLDKLGKEMSVTLESLQKTVKQAEATLQSVDHMVAPAAPLSTELQHTLTELSDAARTLRILADYLERHPEALIRGKTNP